MISFSIGFLLLVLCFFCVFIIVFGYLVVIYFDFGGFVGFCLCDGSHFYNDDGECIVPPKFTSHDGLANVNNYKKIFLSDHFYATCGFYFLLNGVNDE